MIIWFLVMKAIHNISYILTKNKLFIIGTYIILNMFSKFAEANLEHILDFYFTTCQKLILLKN